MQSKSTVKLSGRELRLYRADLLRLVRDKACEAGFAVRFLQRDERSAVLRVVGLAILLVEIFRPAISDGSESTAGAGDAAGCSCQDGSGLVMERFIAENIVSYIYHEAQPGSTGRPEIELYISVLEQYGIAEEAWQGFVAGIADYFEQKRFATRRSMNERVDGVVEAVIELVGPIVFKGGVSGGVSGGASGGDEKVRQGLVMLGRGMMQTQALGCVRLEWESRQRLLIPLDILSEFGLRDNDITAMLDRSLVNDEVLGKVIQGMVDDAASCFARGCDIISELSGPTGRSILLYALQWKMILVRIAKAYATVPRPAGENEAGGGGVREVFALRKRDRFRLMRRGLFLDAGFLREGFGCE